MKCQQSKHIFHTQTIGMMNKAITLHTDPHTPQVGLHWGPTHINSKLGKDNNHITAGLGTPVFAGHYHVILWNGSREFYNMFSFVTDILIV